MRKLNKKGVILIGIAVMALLLWYLHRKKQAEEQAQETFYPTAPTTYYGSQEAAGNFGNYGGGGGGGGPITGGGLPVGEVPGVTTTPDPLKEIKLISQQEAEEREAKRKAFEEQVNTKYKEHQESGQVGTVGYYFENGELHKSPPKEPGLKPPAPKVTVPPPGWHPPAHEPPPRRQIA